MDEGARREQWRRDRSQRQQTRPSMGRPTGKGIGPNKASGHKGGISRQGSKR